VADAFRKVQRGDPLAIPAAAYNAFLDVALDHRRRQQTTRRQDQREFRQTGIALVRNDSGADRERFDVLGLAGPIIRPTDNADEFQNRVAFKGVVPTADHGGSFAVLLEPLAPGAVGRACLDGVCAARVEMADETHGFAEAAEGVADRLRSIASGTARLLWVQPVAERDDPAVAWTILRVGDAPGGPLFAQIKSIGDDHLVCRTYDFATQQQGPADILVAKAWHLRRTPFDGSGYTYSSPTQRTHDATGRTEQVTPDWTLDEEVILIQRAGAGTGVAVDPGGGPVPLVWIDLNWRPHDWAEVC